MTAPTKSFTTFADSAVDPDSPLDTALMTGLRDNDIHLEEWLGMDYAAAQNHDHDGANSKAVVGVADGTITQPKIAGGAVGQAQLKTTTASGSLNLNNGVSGNYTLTGGAYSWWTAGSTGQWDFENGDTAAGVLGVGNFGAGNSTFYVDERYVQASPPWNLGNGDIALFIFGLMASDGTLRSVSVAPDPVWGNNGPTNIQPERWQGLRAFRRYPEIEGLAVQDAFKNRAVLQRFLALQSPIDVFWREVTMSVKNADMPLFPHPWIGNDLTDLTPILIAPTSALIDRLALLHADQGAREIRRLIEAGYLDIGNTPLALNAPPGVMPVAASWKLTA